eukprot:GILJ01021441.1.p1 GENE.GILJ01021441.1~~GILJ01021441.1.p1  ORF type:complete len:878 (+),score=142.43 GILJ01021441.1:165-2636(+)
MLDKAQEQMEHETVRFNGILDEKARTLETLQDDISMLQRTVVEKDDACSMLSQELEANTLVFGCQLVAAAWYKWEQRRLVQRLQAWSLYATEMKSREQLDQLVVNHSTAMLERDAREKQSLQDLSEKYKSLVAAMRRLSGQSRTKSMLNRWQQHVQREQTNYQVQRSVSLTGAILLHVRKAERRQRMAFWKLNMFATIRKCQITLESDKQREVEKAETSFRQLQANVAETLKANETEMEDYKQRLENSYKDQTENLRVVLADQIEQLEQLREQSIAKLVGEKEDLESRLEEMKSMIVGVQEDCDNTKIELESRILELAAERDDAVLLYEEEKARRQEENEARIAAETQRLEREKNYIDIEQFTQQQEILRLQEENSQLLELSRKQEECIVQGQHDQEVAIAVLKAEYEDALDALKDSQSKKIIELKDETRQLLRKSLSERDESIRKLTLEKDQLIVELDQKRRELTQQLNQQHDVELNQLRSKLSVDSRKELIRAAVHLSSSVLRSRSRKVCQSFWHRWLEEMQVQRSREEMELSRVELLLEMTKAKHQSASSAYRAAAVLKLRDVGHSWALRRQNQFFQLLAKGYALSPLRRRFRALSGKSPSVAVAKMRAKQLEEHEREKEKKQKQYHYTARRAGGSVNSYRYPPLYQRQSLPQTPPSVFRSLREGVDFMLQSSEDRERGSYQMLAALEVLRCRTLHASFERLGNNTRSSDPDIRESQLQQRISDTMDALNYQRREQFRLIRHHRFTASILKLSKVYSQVQLKRIAHAFRTLQEYSAARTSMTHLGAMKRRVRLDRLRLLLNQRKRFEKRSAFELWIDKCR